SRRGQAHSRDVLRGPREVPLDADQPVPATDENEAAEEAFRESWRQELLSRAWKALEQVERETGQPYHEVLRLRVDQPDLASGQIAERLAERPGRGLTPSGVRPPVHRGRERFAALLLDDIRQSLDGAPL